MPVGRSRMSRSRPLLLATLVLLAAGGAGLWFFRAPPTPPAAPVTPAPTATSAPAGTQAPSTPPPAAPARPVTPALASPATGFVGSEKCADCHDDEHAAWRQDWHARALSEATPRFVVGDFTNTHFKGESSEAWMFRPEGRYVMRTRGPSGAIGDFPLSWVVGGRHMQDPLTVMPDGRWQVLPVYFHVTGQGEWVDYSEAKQGVLSTDHPFFWSNWQRNAQHACLDCHVTGLEARYDRQHHQWSTGFVDAGVACESCHGPGARHVESQLKKDIVQPAKLPREQGLAVCAQCHGPHRTLFPSLDSVHRYQPGDKYEDHYKPMVVLLNDTFSGDYFEDGRPKTSSFEYQALIQSRCYLKGGATCLTCHSAPHVEHAANEVKQPKHASAGVSVNAASCQGCHAKEFAAGPQHTKHTAAEAQDCLTCHMPPTVSGVLDHFADHALDVPAPQNTVRHGIPNACNACHAHEKTPPASMAEALDKLWPHAPVRQERRVRLADALDPKTADSSRAPLEAVLADKQEAPSLRGVAAQLLARRYAKEAVPALKAALTTATDASLRSDLADALASTGPREVADILAPLLKDSSAWVRQSAALPLGGVGEPRGVAALEEMVRKPEWEGLASPHVVLGQLALRRGDTATGTQQLERSLELQPYNASVLVILADVYARQGDMGRARERLEDALRFDPQNRGALQRIKLMQQGRAGP